MLRALHFDRAFRHNRVDERQCVLPVPESHASVGVRQLRGDRRRAVASQPRWNAQARSPVFASRTKTGARQLRADLASCGCFATALRTPSPFSPCCRPGQDVERGSCDRASCGCFGARTGSLPSSGHGSCATWRRAVASQPRWRTPKRVLPFSQSRTLTGARQLRGDRRRAVASQPRWRTPKRVLPCCRLGQRLERGSCDRPASVWARCPARRSGATADAVRREAEPKVGRQ